MLKFLYPNISTLYLQCHSLAIHATSKLEFAKSRDPAAWWKVHLVYFPLLAPAILQMFAIIPSTAGAERAHAQTKVQISSQQTRMDPNPKLAEDNGDIDDD